LAVHHEADFTGEQLCVALLLSRWVPKRMKDFGRRPAQRPEAYLGIDRVAFSPGGDPTA
jgi:hypothetical protein